MQRGDQRRAQRRCDDKLCVRPAGRGTTCTAVSVTAWSPHCTPMFPHRRRTGSTCGALYLRRRWLCRRAPSLSRMSFVACSLRVRWRCAPQQSTEIVRLAPSATCTRKSQARQSHAHHRSQTTRQADMFLDLTVEGRWPQRSANGEGNGVTSTCVQARAPECAWPMAWARVRVFAA